MMREAGQGWFRGAVIVVCVLGAFLTGCSRDPNVRKQKYLESGQRYYDKGQYREAAIQFQNAIQVDGRFAEAHYRMAQTAAKLGQGPGALQEFQSTLQINPDYDAARLEYIKFLISLGVYNEAKTQLDVLKQRQPNNPEVWIALAMYDNEGTKNTAVALADLRKALQLDPKRSETYLSLGVLEAQGKQWDEAEVNLKKAVDLGPNSVDALVALGNYLQTRGRFPEAEQVFRRAIQNAPNDPAPRLSMEGLFLAENKLTEAEDFLRQSKKDFADNSVGYCMLGNFYIQTNQIDKALAEYASLYRDHGKDPIVRRNYIQLLIMKDKLEDAQQLNDEILKSEPSDLEAQIYKGQIQIHQGKGSDAIDTLQGVLKNDPDSAVTHYQLGLAFNQIGNDTRAEAEWRDAVRLAPDLLNAHRALAGIASQRNDWSFLAQEAEQIVSLQPADPQGYWLHARADIGRKQYASAEDFIKRAIEKDPNNPNAYLQLADLRLAQENLADAQKAYQQALNQDPNSVDALFGVARIDVAEKQPDKALAVIKDQLARYPNNSGFHTLLGTLLKEQKKDLAGAEAEYKRAVELDKNNAPAWINLGLVQGERGDQSTALQTYLDGARNNPKDVHLYLLAGGIYESKEDWDHAKQMYEKALAAQPDNPIASNDMAYVMLQQGGNLDVAFAMAQTARRQLPDNANSADTLGWAFYQKHVYQSAIGLFQEAVKKDPDNPLYNFHLGMAYAKNGQVTQARQQLDRLTRMKSSPSQADDLRRALTEATKGQS